MVEFYFWLAFARWLERNTGVFRDALLVELDQILELLESQRDFLKYHPASSRLVVSSLEYGLLPEINLDPPPATFGKLLSYLEKQIKLLEEMMIFVAYSKDLEFLKAILAPFVKIDDKEQVRRVA